MNLQTVACAVVLFLAPFAMGQSGNSPARGDQRGEPQTDAEKGPPAHLPSENEQRALLEIVKAPGSRTVRGDALDSLLALIEHGEKWPEERASLAAQLVGIARNGAVPAELRERTMAALVREYMQDSTFKHGLEIAELARDSQADNDGVRNLARAAAKRAVGCLPGDADRLTTHEHEAVRAAATAKIKEWRLLDRTLPYADIVRLLEWKEQRLRGLGFQIEAMGKIVRTTSATQRRKERQRTWVNPEDPQVTLTRLRKQERELKRLPLIETAAYEFFVYQEAMQAIADGERRAKERASDAVKRASEPRGAIEITLEDYQWQAGPANSMEQVKVGESSFVLDLDQLLGPREAPTAAELEELKRPDSIHARAIVAAKRTAERILMLSPEGVETAIDYFCKQTPATREVLVPLPKRR